jgi:hypothetical protein
MGKPIMIAKITRQLFTKIKRIGNIICPTAQPVISVTIESFRNRSAPISDTYNKHVSSKPVRHRPYMNIRIISVSMLVDKPQIMFKTPPMKSDTLRILILPK